MERTIKNNVNRFISLMLILVIMVTSCSPNPGGPKPLDESSLRERSITIIERAIRDETVRNALKAENDDDIDALLEGNLTARETVTRALGEDGGTEYLTFMVTASDAGSGNSGLTAEDVFRSAEGLCDEASLEDARAQVAELEKKMMEDAEEETRAMTTAQQKRVYRELRKLVVKAAVLLTAAIVYAAVPHMMFWGKVSAASACAIAAGVLAATIMYLIECSKFGSAATSFEEFVEDISKEPSAAWAIASGLISTNIAMGHSPVVTAIVIGVFAIYGIRDDVMPLLKKTGTSRK